MVVERHNLWTTNPVLAVVKVSIINYLLKFKIDGFNEELRHRLRALFAQAHGLCNCIAPKLRIAVKEGNGT